MKRKLTLTLSLLFGATCASHSASEISNVANATRNAPLVASAKPTTSDNAGRGTGEAEKEKDIPLEFGKVDFKSFSYPTSGWRRRVITLRGGKYEYADVKNGGGDSYELDDVDYVDLVGDGRKEAVVQLQRISCGGSCDGGSELLYFYSISRNKPKLLGHIETGGMAYGCGLKSFEVNNRVITMELYRPCHFIGLTFASEYGTKEVSNYEAWGYTRFLFKFDRRKLALVGRKVFNATNTPRD